MLKRVLVLVMLSLFVLGTLTACPPRGHADKEPPGQSKKH